MESEGKSLSQFDFSLFESSVWSDLTRPVLCSGQAVLTQRMMTRPDSLHSLDLLAGPDERARV